MLYYSIWSRDWCVGIEVALDSKVARLQKDLEALKETNHSLQVQLKVVAKQHNQDMQAVEVRKQALDRYREQAK